MSRYIVKRILYIIFVAFIITIILFFLYKSIPGGDMARVMAYVDQTLKQTNPDLYIIQMKQAELDLGIGQPVILQYFMWLKETLSGNFGYTLAGHVLVIDYVKAPMLNTIKLNLLVMFFVFIITFPLGIKTAVKKYSTFDNGVQIFTIVGMSLPSFFIALISILIFSAWLRILPSSGSNSGIIVRETMTAFERLLDNLKYMILPVFVLTVSSLAGITRYVRGTMIDILQQDYIRTARAKGLREKVVIYSHAFRNAMIPVVTIMTGWVLGIFGGSTITETIFAWKGMGKTLYDALMQGPDYSVILAMNLFYTMLGLVGNLLLDMLYTVVDPRVKLG
ncbi:MAG TPA: ABC transporter permease [Acholeplasmatales bacterium]|nr:ABC transporter permease [Acholeplasmatales bacterium]